MEIEPVRNEHDEDIEALAHLPRFQAMLEHSRRSIRETGGLSGEEVWDDVDGDDEPAAQN